MPQDAPDKPGTATALVALGSNATSHAGGPRDTVTAALERLPGPGLRLLRHSPFYLTPCFPPGSGPDFVNAAAALECTLAPRDLLERLHAIEADFCRERRRRWAPRTLDLDLLALGAMTIPDAATQDRWRTLSPTEQARIAPDTLILPHPRLQDRAFVLVPLAEIAPDWQHPRTGLTVAQMCAALPQADRRAIRAL